MGANPWNLRFPGKYVRYIEIWKIRGTMDFPWTKLWKIMVPSGKHIKNYGISPFLMGKSTYKW
jgi:hypothetical protein